MRVQLNGITLKTVPPKKCSYLFASNNFVKVIDDSGTRIGFLILLSKASKVPIYYSPVA